MLYRDAISMCQFNLVDLVRTITTPLVYIHTYNVLTNIIMMIMHITLI